MGKDELIALLQNLQGNGAGGVVAPGPLAQLPSLLDGTPANESRGAAIGSAAVSAAGSGLTLLPAVSALLKLFGAGKKEPPPALEKSALPAPIRAEAGLSATGETFSIDRGVGDRIRPLPVPAAGTPAPGNGASAPPGGAGANITVNIQAMDSQSFLDRREDIARAVREAMLQSHSLNDVVSEL